MTDELDPHIQSLFEQSPTPEASAAFTSGVMDALNRQDRQRKLRWFALDLAAEIGLRPEFQEFPLADANRALVDMKQSKIRGAKVLRLT